MVTQKKFPPATRKRLDALRGAYRRARQYFYGATGRMDAIWGAAIERLGQTAGADAQDALIDTLAADLQPYVAAVPPDAPPAPSRRKPAGTTPS